ncbi:hypothetical protein DICPUDRAFT_147973 [Dictyostelium purpureum]|uniref:MYND-type domain-containing protein n=1 Tax=Dictyostelium purpureum TaxID=5786 RepID=F0Z9W9_DICPU|nr:uncharacterized protein DICPUDRAFT_147973 [Dictyostelium purpureum]EGC39312.1 hypothetical protein DICPUDRAFT_147973 [Dictyostelium purpureum]|eukprot:XP_003284216.1 hypothetical protein DICPUDRAFT_147973 [Dictyostelium purpureum]
MIPSSILNQNNRTNELIKLYKENYYNSKGIELRTSNNSDKDLGVFSTRKFKKGEEILSNIEPYVHSVPQHNIVCDYCLKNKNNENLNTTISLKRCTGCKLIYYCSIDCQKKAWPIHKHECKILLAAAQESLQINKPINTKSTVMLLRIFIKRMLEIQNSNHIDKTGQFEIIDYLLNHKEERVNDNYKSFSMGICQQLNEDPSKAPIVLEYLLKLEPNCITIPKCEASTIGLYPLMVFFNHSCKPNLSILNNKKELKIICNRDINENEELFINYSPSICYSNERREMLKQCFFFDCKCELCLKDELEKSMDLYILCNKCNKGRVNIWYDENKNRIVKCLNCSSDHNADEILKKNLITTKLQKCLDQFINQNSELNIDEFKLLLNQYCKQFYYTDPLFYEIVNKTDLFFQDFNKEIETNQMKHYHQRYQALLKHHFLDTQNLQYEYCRQLVDYSNILIQIGYFKEALGILKLLNKTLSKINYYGFNQEYLISMENELSFNIDANYYQHQ